MYPKKTEAIPEMKIHSGIVIYPLQLVVLSMEKISFDFSSTITYLCLFRALIIVNHLE